MKEIKIFFNPPFFISMATAAKFVLPIPIFFLAYLVLLDVDVTGNITAQICEVWSKFNIFCTLVTMATAAILKVFNSKSCHTLRWIFLQSFIKFDERNPNFFLNPPFFVSMTTAAKFVQPIPICLAYLVLLDVDVVPSKFYQFLFDE